MRLELRGRSPVDAAADLIRAAEAALAVDPIADYSRSQKKVIRPRFRSMIAATKDLAPKLAQGVEAMRAPFFARLGIAREAAGDDNDTSAADLAKYLAAADAMTPTELAQALRRSYEDLYDQGVAHVRLELRTAFDLPPTRALAALDDYALTFASDVANAEKASLKALIRQAFEDGLVLPELARDIREHFDDGVHRIGRDGSERTVDVDAWSLMVARTETARAQNAGTLDGYRSAGLSRVIWVTANDERVCPICRPLDGAVADLGEPFPGTDFNAGPAHPNCRCTLVAYSDVTKSLARAA
ncbi:MAG: minor capsid protein [Candidatus Eremiobacteraeota bacterium]|nr:minor capsid protein [Candidatus Eremiobacteraeota bacterium]